MNPIAFNRLTLGFILKYHTLLDLFVVLCCVQQPGSYCDGQFTGGGTSAY